MTFAVDWALTKHNYLSILLWNIEHGEKKSDKVAFIVHIILISFRAAASRKHWMIRGRRYLTILTTAYSVQ